MRLELVEGNFMLYNLYYKSNDVNLKVEALEDKICQKATRKEIFLENIQFSLNDISRAIGCETKWLETILQ